MELQVCSVIHVPDANIEETIVDEVFDQPTATHYKKNHVLSPRCDSFIARDAGDNLIVMANGYYHYWDNETDRLIVLGSDPSEFVVGHDE